MNYNEEYNKNVTNSINDLKSKIIINQLDIDIDLNNIINIFNRYNYINLNSFLSNIFGYITDLNYSRIKLKKNLDLLKNQIIIYSKELEKDILFFNKTSLDILSRKNKINYLFLLLEFNLNSLNKINTLLNNIKKKINNNLNLFNTLLDNNLCNNVSIRIYLINILSEKFEIFKEDEYDYYNKLKQIFIMIRKIIIEKNEENLKKIKKDNKIFKLFCF